MATTNFGGGGFGGGGAGRDSPAPKPPTGPKPPRLAPIGGGYGGGGGGGNNTIPAIVVITTPAKSEKVKPAEKKIPTINQIKPYVQPQSNLLTLRVQTVNDIRAGKYDGIAIVGNTIINTRTGNPVNVTGATVFDSVTRELFTKNNKSAQSNKNTDQTAFFNVGEQNQFFKDSKAAYDAQNSNVVTFLLDETGNKVAGVEYRGVSYSAQNFQNVYGVKPLVDPTTKEFFFGTVAPKENKLPSRVSAGYTPITKEEKKQVQMALFNARIKEGRFLDAVTNTQVQAYLRKQESYAYDAIVSVTTTQLDNLAKLAKQQATAVLNASDLHTGNKVINLTEKTLGRLSYWSGSTVAYGLNMISGLGNIALGLTFKQNETGVQLVKSAPAMIKQSIFEIGRTFTGNGTIEDFLGTAVTAATIGTTVASFARLNGSLKGAKVNGQLKKDLPQIREAIRKSQTLLKKEQLYTQRVFMQNSNKWKTFGNAYQAFNNAKAKHSWVAVSEEGKSVVRQMSLVENKNVRILNIMVAKSVSDKILGFLRKYNNGKVVIAEAFPNSKKLATYFSKIRAKREYTFIEVKGSKGITAIDGKGNIKLINSMAEFQKFIKNAKFGKFSATGKRALGGDIGNVLRFGKKGFIGGPASATKRYVSVNGKKVLSRNVPSLFSERKSVGVTIVKELEQLSDAKVLDYFRGKKGSKVFRTIKEPTMKEWRKSVDNAVKNLNKWGKENPSQVKSIIKDLKRVYNPKELTDAQWRASTQSAAKKLDSWAKKNPDKIRAFATDARLIFKAKGMTKAEWQRSVNKAVSNLNKFAKSNPDAIRYLVKDLKRVYKPKQMSNAVWQRSTKQAVRSLESWAKNNPLQLRSLVQDLKRVYKTKTVSNSQIRKIYDRNIRNLENFARANPQKIRSFARDVKALNAPLEANALPERIGLSKGISNSVTSSQLKGVAKAIEKAIAKSDVAVKAGFRGVVGASGVMFFTQQGKLVSPNEALRGSSKHIDSFIDKVRDIAKDNTAQPTRFNFASGSAQRSGQQSKQQQMMQQQAMQRAGTRSRTGMRLQLKLEPKVRFPLPDLDRKKQLLVKSILGNKLAPSYEIYIGSGKKVKKLGGRYTPQEAISKGAYVIDRTKERTVRIVPTKQKANSSFKINYLAQAGRKFRNYRIKQGRKVAYSSTRLIEKRKFFNDFRGEIPKKKKRK